MKQLHKNTIMILKNNKLIVKENHYQINNKYKIQINQLLISLNLNNKFNWI